MATTGNQPANPVGLVTQTDGRARLSMLEALRERLLQVRRVYLHHRQPRTPYGRRLREDIRSGRARPVEMLYTISSDDLADGAPIEAVLRPYLTIVALLEEQAREREASRPTLVPLSLESLHQRETRAEAVLNEAQNAALAHPDDPAVLAAMEDAATQYEVAEHQLVSAARRIRQRLVLGMASQ